MGSYAYDKNTGTLTTLSTSGQRIWTGTEAQYKQAQTAGTLPNNAIICITDDEVDTSHYSTDEIFTGMYWIDGKKIYRKVIDIGAMPNSTTKDVDHNISNLDKVIDIRGIVTSITTGNATPIQYTWPTTTGYEMCGIYTTTTQIRIKNNDDRTNFTAVVILEYTKTTDD